MSLSTTKRRKSKRKWGKGKKDYLRKDLPGNLEGLIVSFPSFSGVLYNAYVYEKKGNRKITQL
jgi:hypothetical protein